MPGSTAARMATYLFAALLLQIVLGLTAYIVLLDEQGMLVPSNLQVVVNTTHLIIGALLFLGSAVLSVLTYRLDRRNRTAPSSVQAATALNPA